MLFIEELSLLIIADDEVRWKYRFRYKDMLELASDRIIVKTERQKTVTEIMRNTGRQTHRHTQKQTDRQTDTHRDRQTDRQTRRHTDSQ